MGKRSSREIVAFCMGILSKQKISERKNKNGIQAVRRRTDSKQEAQHGEHEGNAEQIRIWDAHEAEYAVLCNADHPDGVFHHFPLLADL